MSHLLRRAICTMALGVVITLAGATAGADSVTYTVRPGDSLWLIAKRQGISMQDLARANGLRDDQGLQSGVKLTIPQPKKSSAPQAGRTRPTRPTALTSRRPNLEVPKPAESIYHIPPLAAQAPPDGRGAPSAAPSLAEPSPRSQATSAVHDASRAHAIIALLAPRAAASSTPKAPSHVSSVASVAPARPTLATIRPIARDAAHRDRPTSAAAPTPVAVPLASASARANRSSVIAPVRAAPQPAAVPAPALDAAPLPDRALRAEPTLAVAQPQAEVSSPRFPNPARASKPEAASHDSDRSLFSSSSEKSGTYGLMTALDFALKLVLVIILAYVCMLALKKFSQRRAARSGKGAGLRVVDTIGLAPNRQLHIVSLGERAYLLGSTPESVSLIADLPQTPGADAPASAGGEQVVDEAFSRRLKELMKAAPARRPASPGVGSRLAQAARFIQARSNQMRPLGEIIDETVSGA